MHGPISVHQGVKENKPDPPAACCIRRPPLSFIMQTGLWTPCVQSHLAWPASSSCYMPASLRPICCSWMRHQRWASSPPSLSSLVKLHGSEQSSAWPRISNAVRLREHSCASLPNQPQRHRLGPDFNPAAAFGISSLRYHAPEDTKTYNLAQVST